MATESKKIKKNKEVSPPEHSTGGPGTALGTFPMPWAREGAVGTQSHAGVWRLGRMMEKGRCRQAELAPG